MTNIKSGADLKALRQSVGLSQQSSADLVHVTLNAWQKWESGERPINRAALELFMLKSGAPK
ncbi:MAG: helix-turn-helix domain-containing protein [Thiobacillus sp.]